MIKPQELRIGNWLIDGNGSYYQVEIPDLALLLSRPDTKECNPIPLSAEILEKAGFEKSGMLYIHPSTMNFEIWNRAKTEGVTRWYAGRMQKDYFLGISNEIKYLHQLQNLYFALTGEELPIEL